MLIVAPAVTLSLIVSSKIAYPWFSMVPASTRPSRCRLVLERVLVAASAIATADERLVNFDMPRKRPLTIRARHQLAEFVRHTPRRLVCATDLPLQFLCRNAMTGRSHEVHREKPVRQFGAGLVENRPRTRVDVVATVLAGEGLSGRHGVKLGLCNATAWAGNPRAAELDVHDCQQAGCIVRELFLELFESIFHGRNPHLLGRYSGGLLAVKG